MTGLIVAALVMFGPDDTPEGKALAYLAAEVPRWSIEHKCFSCHNNGDGVRALYSAIKLGRDVPTRATIDTDRWLSKPEGWDKNGGEGPTSDKAMARVQFAAATASAVEAGRIKDRKPLLAAAARIAEDQAEDGSWKVDEQGVVGSPVTYGRPLATAIASRTLQFADPARYREANRRAEAWLLKVEPINTPDAAAILLILDPKAAPDRREPALGFLKMAQGKDGGWGPFDGSSPEAFDTAIALIALDRHRDRPGVGVAIERGRRYLVGTQNDDGSWAETTRPANAESYAQRVSTTAWATLALLANKANPKPPDR